MNLRNLTRRQILSIIGLVVLLAGMGTGIFLVLSGGLDLFSRAGPTALPRQITVSNVDSDTFTVSWISDTNVSGFVKYGTEPGRLNQTLSDDRDQLSGTVGMYTTHYVTVRNLTPSTVYYFSLGSGSQTYNDVGDAPYAVNLPATLSKPEADVISGKVLLPNGQPVGGAIVYVNIEGAATRSAQTRASGVWTLPLQLTRTADLSAYLSYDPQNTQLNIFVQAADLGTATVTVNTANDSPVPDITLGEALELATPSAQVVGGVTIEIENNVLSATESSVAAGGLVTIINRDGVNHSVVAVNNEFDTGPIGGGGNASFTAPAAPGAYVFFDNLNPEIETLRGRLIVTLAGEIAPSDGEVGVATPSGAGFASDLPTLPEIDEAYEATLSVKLVTPIDQGELIATSTPEFRVSGPVGQSVTITVRSDPQTVTTTFDADGEVEFTPPEGLEPGEHTLEIEYVDQNGVLQKITRTFVVLAAEGTTGTGGLPAFTSTPSADLSPTPTATLSPTPTSTASATSGAMPSTSAGVPESGVLTMTVAIFMMGLALFAGGVIWQVKLAKVKTR